MTQVAIGAKMPRPNWTVCSARAPRSTSWRKTTWGWRCKRMDAYIVIGNPNTRKASLVRSLTGCFNRSVRDIQPLGGKPVLRLYARVGALQDTKCGTADFLAEVARARCGAVLCCLAPSAHPDHAERFPDAQAYLAAFKRGRLAHPRDRGAGAKRRRRALAEPAVLSAGAGGAINHTARAVRGTSAGSSGPEVRVAGSRLYGPCACSILAGIRLISVRALMPFSTGGSTSGGSA